ncbi:MAG: chlorite dismutase family protein [Chloroflexota bacterium]|nr:chlorite dismutase family protein [Chloroflexota bacterium]
MATQVATESQQIAPRKTQRQYVRFAFYKASPAFRALPAEVKERSKAEFISVLEGLAEEGILRVYSTVGTRADADLLVWHVSDNLDALHEGAARLNRTELGRYIELSHNFVSMTKRSIYIDNHKHHGQEGARTRIRPANKKYLFVYPFVKTRQWYLLPKEERQKAMDVHIEVGHRYPSVRLNTTYSFGLDDQDFVVAFETDSPADFLDLVMDLRETESSLYTQRDTPIFSCISQDPATALDALG